MSKPRIAVCISGEMRSFERAFRSIKQHLIDPYEPDIFIHTWSHRGAPTQARQTLPKWILRAGRYLSWVNSLNLRYVKMYDSLAKKYPDEDSVSLGRLESLYSPRRIVIEDFPDNGLWDLHGKVVPEILLKRIAELDHLEGKGLVSNRAVTGGLPMFYKIYACNELRKEYEREMGVNYDVIVRLRPDLQLKAIIPEETLHDIQTLHVSVMGKPGAYNNCRVSDQMAWGAPDVMDCYSATWIHLEELYKELARDKHAKLFGGEVVLKFYMNQCGLLVENYNLHDALLRPVANQKRVKEAWRGALLHRIAI